MRYYIALIFPLVLAAGFLIYHLWVATEMKAAVQQARASALKAGLISKDDPGDFGIPMSRNMTTMIKIDHIIMTLWFVPVLVVLLIALGVAALLPRSATQPPGPPIADRIDPLAKP